MEYRKEIGGYLELEQYELPMLYDDAILLNCGRSALAYLIEVRNIKKIYMPFFICDTLVNVCNKYNVEVNFYGIDEEWHPKLGNIYDEWLYIINYYGQLESTYIDELRKDYKNIIVDNTQAYYVKPVEDIDTLYSCRKYFGVSDGGILFCNKELKRELIYDTSYNRMEFVLGRYEKNASEFYLEASKNNDFFDNEPIKKMSKLTRNILHSIDYDKVSRIRTDNYLYLNNELSAYNKLNLRNVEGAFMYPLMVDNASEIRAILQKKKIYIPILWPEVLSRCSEDSLEFRLANNILPIPVDQRYDIKDMQYIIEELREILYKD